MLAAGSAVCWTDWTDWRVLPDRAGRRVQETPSAMMLKTFLVPSLLTVVLHFMTARPKIAARSRVPPSLRSFWRETNKPANCKVTFLSWYFAEATGYQPTIFFFLHINGLLEQNHASVAFFLVLSAQYPAVECAKPPRVALRPNSKHHPLDLSHTLG